MYVQAAKAAVMNFFDTLRVELGTSIGGITIVTPGWIQSDLTMGRFLDKSGSMDAREDKRDVSCPNHPTVLCPSYICTINMTLV